MRRGIISAGNWLADTVKFIPVFPSPGNLVTIERIEMGFGGCSHNVLVDLAHLETDIPLYAGGCIGEDPTGDAIMNDLRKLQIDSSCMYRSTVPTSYTDVMADREHGTRTFFHFRGANATLSDTHIESMNVEAKIFHLGYLLLLDELDAVDNEYGIKAARVLHRLQQKGYKTSADVVSEEGTRFRKVVLPCLPYMDYFIINEVEAGACFGKSLRNDKGEILLDEVEAAAHFMLNRGVSDACFIHFPEGGFGMKYDGETCYEPSLKVKASEIVSSVGAGDAFCAGVLYALHEGFSLKESLRIGNVSAYFNLKNATSTGGAPTLLTIMQFIKSNYSK